MVNNPQNILSVFVAILLSALPIYSVAEETPTPTSAPQTHSAKYNSLMFNEKEMDIINKLVESFDTSSEKISNNTNNVNKSDDLNGLLKKNPDAKKVIAHDEVPTKLPNIYVGSILYYSAKDWSIWINGNKYGAEYNNEKNEFYISKISRKEVELIWKPKFSIIISNAWQRFAKNGKIPKHIDFDSQKNVVTLLMRANQTFIPDKLIISEGFIKSGFMPITDNKKTEEKP